jgi:hypothetical protein
LASKPVRQRHWRRVLTKPCSLLGKVSPMTRRR